MDERQLKALETDDIRSVLESLLLVATEPVETAVFAEILGVGAAFSKRFADWQPEPCAWLTDALSHPRTAKEFYQLYSELASAVRAEPYGRFTGLSGQTPQRRRRRRAPMKDYYEEEV